MYRTVFWTLWERARVGWFGRMALNHVYYHMWNRSPVQIWCMGQGARGWCTGMTKSHGMGREVREEFRMGNTCTPMADSWQCMAKPLQYYKLISLQLKWINLYFKKDTMSSYLWGEQLFGGLGKKYWNQDNKPQKKVFMLIPMSPNWDLITVSVLLEMES